MERLCFPPFRLAVPTGYQVDPIPKEKFNIIQYVHPGAVTVAMYTVHLGKAFLDYRRYTCRWAVEETTRE